MRLNVTAAVLSEELGLSVLAEVHKKDAEKVLASDPDFSAWFPGLDEYDGACTVQSGRAEAFHVRRMKQPAINIV